MPNDSYTNPKICPLCGADNACSEPSLKAEPLPCWCSDPSLQFPEALLAKVSTELRGQACICKACALKHQSDQ